MFGLSRLSRLVLVLLIVVIGSSLYFLYPHHDIAIAPDQEQHRYEAGGIDSEHWRKPVRPDFEHEEARWNGDDDLRIEEDQRKDLAVGTPVRTELYAEAQGVMGGVIMPKLGNETAKAELGRAAWHVMHLMTLRYPENPTEDDRQALKSYFHLFSRLYPCGECAAEFQLLLKEYPPQTSSRKAASMWLCHVHNMVNERLGKEEFDCLTLNEKYDCGCGPEGEGAGGTSEATSSL